MVEATFSIFSDTDSADWADALAALLREGGPGRVDIADSLDAAFDGDADVLILNLDPRRDRTRLADHLETLKRRRIIAMAAGAAWLCDRLDEIDFSGRNITNDMAMLVVDNALLGRRLAEPIRPFREVQETPPEAWTLQTPRVYFSDSIVDYRPGVDDILVPEHNEDCAVVVRQASFVFAGVQAHPDEWSEQYRALIGRVAFALAERPVEGLKPIVVERQIHPPGAVRFELGPTASGADRDFYFRFERPTAFTATLEHAGSNAMMMMFSGGKKHLHGTRVDTEDGRTLTIAADIGENAIEAVGHRYWLLAVCSFDRENACSAKLTVRYDTADSGASVRALPGNASFEYVNGVAWGLGRAAQTDAAVQRRLQAPAGPAGAVGIAASRLATAREHGFESWGDIEAHVAWSPGFDMRGGTFGANRFDARIRAQYGESFTMEQLIEYAEDFTDELRLAVTEGVLSGAGTFSDEHLLLALLDDPVSAHALECAGAGTDLLRSRLDDSLAAAQTEGPVGGSGGRNVAKAVSGAVYRANFIGALGREGINAANLLAGLLGESCAATNLLKDQGIGQRDIVNYVTHGLPGTVVGEREGRAPRMKEPSAGEREGRAPRMKEPSAGEREGRAPRMKKNQEPGASVFDEQAEEVAHAAFAKARDDASKYVTLDRLLLALLGDSSIDRVLRSMDARVDELAGELHAYIDATLVGAGDDLPQPTRALNRVMQMAVAKARSSERHRATAPDLLWALCGERDVPTADLLDRFEIARPDVAARMG